MSIKDRKEREKDEMRELILNGANEIIAKESLEKLSIRKIAAIIDYSPAIIYHYFKDKDHIINELMKRGYEKIVSTVSVGNIETNDPKEKIKHSLRSYIDMALRMPEEYMSVMLNSSPMILEHTSVLFKGASEKRKAIGMLCSTLKEVYKDKDNDAAELTAQVIWTSVFGLIIRLIVEKDLDEEQKNRLIEHHLSSLISAIVIERT